MTSAPPRAPIAPRNAPQTSRGFTKKPPYKSFKKSDQPKPEPAILAQAYFKSVGPRTYAAQLKKAANGNHFLVFTEGQRDEKTNEVRKTRLFVYSEDFVEFFRMLKQASEFVIANPVDPKVKAKRDKFWAKQRAEAAKSPQNPVPAPAAVAG